jgi:hypothetical protein
VNPVDDPLALTFAATKTQIGRNSAQVRIDPSATLKDVDTVVNYGNTQIRTIIFSGNTPGDSKNDRVVLTLQSQGQGVGLVYVNKSKVYYNGSQVPIATVTGGVQGHALVIKFTDAATEEAVNAVLKQISLKASKKAALGDRQIDMTISAGGQKVLASKTATVV